MSKQEKPDRDELAQWRKDRVDPALNWERHEDALKLTVCHQPKEMARLILWRLNQLGVFRTDLGDIDAHALPADWTTAADELALDFAKRVLCTVVNNDEGFHLLTVLLATAEGRF